MKYRRLSRYKIGKIVECFAEDLPASKAAGLLHINRNTINAYYNELRLKISLSAFGRREKFSGSVQLDESDFGASRVRGKRGRGAWGKVPVFGLLKRDAKVHVEIVENCSKESLLPIIKGKVMDGATIYTDGWKSDDSLILNGYDHHRIYHHENELARGKNHVNGIESFWSFCKRRLAKFNGIAKANLLLHLKECEFRFNHRLQNITPILKKIINRC